MKYLFITMLLFPVLNGHLIAQEKAPTTTLEMKEITGKLEEHWVMESTIRKDKKETKQLKKIAAKEEELLTQEAFGQERAKLAKEANLEKKEAIKKSISKGRKTVIMAKDKVALAKDILEADKRVDEISEEEYQERKEQIDLIEQKTKVLEEKLKKSKEKM